MKKKVMLTVIVLVILVGGVIVIRQHPLEEKLKVFQIIKKPTTSTAVFTCADKKNIKTVFYKDSVDLTLSDARHMVLPQATSASGARYANKDESFVFWNKGNTAFIEEGSLTTFKECVTSGFQAEMPSPSIQVSDAASLNCVKVGGHVSFMEKEDGTQYSLCYFEENRACEVGALMRDECPVGGRKTIGFDTIDQKYCAWLGGETLATENSVCTFVGGSTCTTKELYNGTCVPKK